MYRRAVASRSVIAGSSSTTSTRAPVGLVPGAVAAMTRLNASFLRGACERARPRALLGLEVEQHGVDDHRLATRRHDDVDGSFEALLAVVAPEHDLGIRPGAFEVDLLAVHRRA